MPRLDSETVSILTDRIKVLNALVLVDYNDKFQILYFEQTYF